MSSQVLKKEEFSFNHPLAFNKRSWVKNDFPRVPSAVIAQCCWDLSSNVWDEFPECVEACLMIRQHSYNFKARLAFMKQTALYTLWQAIKISCHILSKRMDSSPRV